SYAVIGPMTLTKGDNAQTFSLSFLCQRPPTTPIGTRSCNVAKNISSPSRSPAGNRKAGAACFVVGGDLRIEKRDANTGQVIAANNPATFRVNNCVNTAVDPAVQPIIINNDPFVGPSHDYAANVL